MHFSASIISCFSVLIILPNTKVSKCKYNYPVQFIGILSSSISGENQLGHVSKTKLPSHIHIHASIICMYIYIHVCMFVYKYGGVQWSQKEEGEEEWRGQKIKI